MVGQHSDQRKNHSDSITIHNKVNEPATLLTVSLPRTIHLLSIPQLFLNFNFEQRKIFSFSMSTTLKKRMA